MGAAGNETDCSLNCELIFKPKTAVVLFIAVSGDLHVLSLFPVRVITLFSSVRIWLNWFIALWNMLLLFLYSWINF